MSKEMKERWEKEIQRAKTAVSERGTVDSEGLITEKSLEIFHIPRAVSEIELLSLADEADCVFEAMTALFLMATREGEARTGANLYAPGWGLLVWNLEWDAKTKMKVWRLHQGLKIGCQDDLAFVIKLAYSFLRAEERDSAEKWEEYYVVNARVLKEVLDNVKDLLNFQYRMEAEEEETRDINPQLLERVRLAMESAWPERIINLKQGEPITYPVAGKAKVGVVSSLCTGNWQGKKQAIVAAAIEGEAVLEGYPQTVPTASFMVQLPGQVPSGSQVGPLVDQRFPVGSLVQVREEKGRFYLIKTEEIPSDEDFFIEGGATIPIEGIWISEKRAEKARIVEWVERDGIPIAVLSPFEEADICSLGKKIGDTLEVKIDQVKRDPVGRRGWIVARTEEGFDIPIELSEMSLSPRGPGLERIEGQTISLTIRDLDATDFPQLSNIDRVIEDLNAIRKEISEKNTFPGYVVEINEEEENATAVLIREDGVVHPFEIYKDFVPGRKLSNLRIGEEVIINLSIPRTERDHVQADRLTKEEVDNIRMLPGGGYDRDKEEVSFSYCLEDNAFNKWPARSEAIDFVKRHSFQYCLAARIEALKERLSTLNEMDGVEGVVTQIDYEEDGKTVKSVQVVVKGNIPGFAFGSDLGSLSVSEGDKIPFYVKAVDPNSGFLRLVSKQSEEEKKKQHEEFIRRTQTNIRRWENNITKARAAIERIRQNIAKNQAKARATRNKEWESRFQFWIDEDERKIRDIELSIRDWLSKIESARSKLRHR